MSIKLNQLRDVLAVARCGGVRAAARELGLAQPTLTKSLQQLEKHLGVALFERSGRGLLLTAFGEAFVARTRAAVSEIQRAEDEVRQLREGGAGRLAVAMAGMSLMNLLPGALASLRRRQPGVQVRVIERPHDQSLQDLRRGEIELAVMPQPFEAIGDEFAVEPILPDRLGVMARRGHPLAGARTLQALGGAEWVVTRQGGERAAEFEQLFRSQGLPVPRVAVQCESIIGTLALLAGTDLLALLPSRWLHTELVRNACAEMVLPALGPARPTCIVRRAAFPLTPAAEAFVAVLVVEAHFIGRSERELSQARGRKPAARGAAAGDEARRAPR
ncbi:MAG TPA: LysR substrate-binding domain-containing protein [Rubrivivax sp.]|nr:LysR substrate-binding domain-containing protein [Rubrivivax sp.]